MRKKALELLAPRDHTPYQLAVKLKRRGYQNDIVEELIEHLIAENLLNEFRFAELWIQSRLRRRPEGRTSLFGGLLKAGVGRGAAEKALNEALTEEVQEDILRRAAEKMLGKKGMTRQKLVAALQAKGFRYSSVRHLLESEEWNIEE